MPSLPNWTFDHVAGAAGLAGLRADWQALVDRLPALDVVQTPQWAAAYLQCLADAPDTLQWITARRAGELVAVWPLQLARAGRAPWALRELRGLSHDHMTLSDIAADPADAALWPALWAWLHSGASLPWDRVVLPKLAETSVLARWWAAHPAPLTLTSVSASALTLPRPPALLRRTPADGSAWIDCRGSWDEVLKAATAKHRSNLQRGLRRAQELGVLRYEVHADPAALTGAFEHFMAIEASGWKGQAGTAMACDARLVAFYGQLSQQLGERGRCEIDLLWLNDQVIAAGYWFRCGHTVALQKTAYREDLAALSPGALLIREALQRACADPDLQRLSFITRCRWADPWRTQLTPVEQLQLYRPSALGQLGAAAAGARDVLKLRVKPWLTAVRQGWRRPVGEPASGPAGAPAR